MFSLFEAFKSIKNEDEFNRFMLDLCTPQEIKDLNDRFAIAQYLNEKNLSQRAIAEKVKCSITTVTRVARFLNQEQNFGYKNVLNTLHHNHHR